MKKKEYDWEKYRDRLIQQNIQPLKLSQIIELIECKTKKQFEKKLKKFLKDGK